VERRLGSQVAEPTSPGRLSRDILRLAVPALGALVAEPLFLIVDAALVGHLGLVPLAGLGVLLLGGLLAVHIAKDLQAPAAHWALRSTFVWVVVMAVASLIHWTSVRKLRRQGFDLEAHFKALPPE